MTLRLDSGSERPAAAIAAPGEAAPGATFVRQAQAWGARGVNWIGMGTLCKKEVERFYKVLGQTILAPMASSVLFLAVFALALGGSSIAIGGVPYVQFLAPGLIMVAVANNSFANTSSSLIIAKLNGTMIDVLMPPLSADELLLGYVVGGVVRGISVAVAVAAAIFPFVHLGVSSWILLFYFALSGCLLFSLLGILTGVVAEKFDHVAAMTNFVVSPLTLLSGSFYSIDRLPEFLQTVIHFNPMFYIIDGFRYSMIGFADGELVVAGAGIFAVNMVLWILCRRLFLTGWRLKS